MRGSVYYQSSQLAKQIFESGAKKKIELIQIMNIIKKLQVIKLWRVIEVFGTIFLTIF